MVRRMFAILICGTALSGCAVHEVHKDHDKIRTALLDLYTNQIMDNLVRTKNGMPIIQVDYTRVSGMVTIKNTLGGMDNQAATASNVLALPAATLSATRTIVTTLAGNLSNENTNQITIEAVPVTTSNEVYDAYLQFLDPTKNPGSLIVSCDAPPPGAAHMCQKYEGMYYWVPIRYRGLFFQLSLLTTAQRGKGLMPQDEFFTVKLFGEMEPRVPGIVLGTQWLTLKLDKAIPTDDQGSLVLDNDKEHGSFPLIRFKGAEPSIVRIAVPDGTAPDVATHPEMANKLPLFNNLVAAPQPGKVFLLHSRPQPPTTNDLINRVNFQLQQIQNNQRQ